tara:strand:+ start:512 stop:760 length:249 start_codon:yes stop_codon:yes gene_type:complete
MKKLLLILSFTLGLTTAASSETYLFGKLDHDVSIKECLKAMEKGNFIGTQEDWNLIFYDETLFKIRAISIDTVKCHALRDWK